MSKLFVTNKRYFSVRRGVRTGKHGPKWFHRGRGCIRLGTLKNNVYRLGVNQDGSKINIDKLLDLQIPSLHDFKLKPYVGWQDPP